MGDQITEGQLGSLREVVPTADIEQASNTEELGKRIGRATVLAVRPGQLSTGLLDAGKRLEWIHLWSAGVDSALSTELVASPAIVTCAKGNGAVPLAEQAILLMLMLDRHAVRWIRNQDRGKWDKFEHGELNGKTCGIIGLGHSGEDLARKARAFHMHVLGMRRGTNPAPCVNELYSRGHLHKMLQRCDFVVVTAPLTDETAGMIGEDEFRAMKPSASFICVSRGGIADDAALLRALREGWIGGAGLDAHGEEPLPENSPFWNTPHTIVTPHNGATTAQTEQRSIDIFADNLRRYMSGHPLLNRVDRRTGY